MLGVIGSEFGNDMEFTNAKPKVHSLAWHTSTFVVLAFMTSFSSCFFFNKNIAINNCRYVVDIAIISAVIFYIVRVT